MFDTVGNGCGMRVACCCIETCIACFETSCDGTWACYESRDVADCRARFFQNVQRVVEIFRSLSGIANDKVCAERELAKALVEFVGENGVILCGVAAVHRLEYAFAPTLYRYVDELVNAFVREAIEQRFLIAEDMARVAHAEANAVIAVHMS